MYSTLNTYIYIYVGLYDTSRHDKIFGPAASIDHDARILRESGLSLRLLQLPISPTTASKFCVFGDSAYAFGGGIVSPFPSHLQEPWKKLFNASMSKCRITVEWVFKEITTTWAFVDFKKNQKVLKQPVGVFYRVAVLLTNIRN